MRLSGVKRIGQQNIPIAVGHRGQRAHAQRRHGESALAVVARVDFARSRWIVEFGLRGAHEHRLVHGLAVIDFGPGDLQALGLHLDGRIQHQQLRQSGFADAVGFRHHEAVAVREREGAIDPAIARVAQLIQIQFARREQRLAQSAVDLVAIDVGIGVSVGTQRLALAERVVKRAPVPQADVFEQRRGWPRNRCGLLFARGNPPRARACPGRRPRASLRCGARCRASRASAHSAARTGSRPAAAPANRPPARRRRRWPACGVRRSPGWRPAPPRRP